MTAIVEFKNFSFTYLGSKEPALKNVNLEIEKGEVVGLIGPTGSGKTTLLMALNGLVPKVFVGFQKGDVIVNGLNTRDYSVSELAQYVGIVLQNPATQLFALRVWDDVAFGPSNLGLSEREIYERVEYALEATRLKGFEHRDPNTLSGGEQQSLAIAGILAMRPKVLALDEPIAMLDPIGKQRVLSVIREIKEKFGTTTIISEAGADIEALSEFVDRMVLINHGEIILDGDPEEVLQSNIFEKIGIERPQVTELFLKMRRIYPDVPIPASLNDAIEIIRKICRGKKLRIRRKVLKESEIVNIKKPVIKVKNVHYVYPPNIHALRGVSLEIYEGEIVAIIGQNGSGKTTLALNLVGLLKPTNPDAQIIVDGIDVIKSPLREIITHINYVFQNPDNQLFTRTIYEELSFGPSQLELPQEVIEQRINEVARLLDIKEHLSEYIARIPYNLKSIVSIASVLTLKPRILIIDEPTTGLDIATIRKIMNVLIRMVNSQELKALIIITHDMDTVANYCTRVIAINKGKVLLDGPTREVFRKAETLQQASLSPPQITLLGQKLKDLNFPEDVLSVDEMYEFLKEVID